MQMAIVRPANSDVASMVDVADRASDQGCCRAALRVEGGACVGVPSGGIVHVAVGVGLVGAHDINCRHERVQHAPVVHVPHRAGRHQRLRVPSGEATATPCRPWLFGCSARGGGRGRCRLALLQGAL